MCEKTVALIKDLAKDFKILSDNQIRFEEQSKARDELVNEKLKARNEKRNDIKEVLEKIHTKLEKQDKRIESNTSYINKSIGAISFVLFLGAVGLKSLFTK